MTQKGYIPAMKFHWLTPIYDPVLKWGMKENKFKTHLVQQGNVKPAQRILDLACGTGTLTLMLKQTQGEAEIVGLDADPEILAIAKNKAVQNKVDIEFQQGMSTDLPFPDAHLDHVFSSLFFHHLTLDMKRRTIEELHRTLRPGGTINIIDFDKPQNSLMRLAFYPIQWLDGFTTTRDHVHGILPELYQECGFENVEQTGQFATIFGTLRSYRAQKPSV
ncbi:class I SAM-dependent methyltransferase [Paenibacillaceae sp. P-4]|uniref:methyltransferase domain-containing protein n=1 Tax=Paenibacillaceae bacterium P-4 TaxID=3160969 RepID=UPI00158011F0